MMSWWDKWPPRRPGKLARRIAQIFFTVLECDRFLQWHGDGSKPSNYNIYIHIYLFIYFFMLWVRQNYYHNWWNNHLLTSCFRVPRVPGHSHIWYVSFLWSSNTILLDSDRASCEDTRKTNSRMSSMPFDPALSLAGVHRVGQCQDAGWTIRWKWIPGYRCSEPLPPQSLGRYCRHWLQHVATSYDCHVAAMLNSR